ncbi:hypothetical protein [Sodalinema gerasimenkoae]|uniref:hypothetical protein n=1 Tax=Sodalinema gerasimenkoae TaxID=2862348 RepID=UPI001359782D|nr:hypothetical protein [Sodalinema gerasimenkoae]
MGLQLIKSQLNSFSVRDAIQAGSDARELVLNLKLPEDLAADNEEGSLWDKIKDWGDALLRTAGLVVRAAAAGFLVGGLVGAIIGGVAVIAASLPWGWIINTVVSVVSNVYNFNWNASDTSLKQQIEGYNNQIMGIWGEWFGRGLGYATSIVVGGGISILMPVIGGKALAAFVAGGVAREALEEMWDELRGAIRQTLSLLGSGVVARGYMGIRSAIKFSLQDVGGGVGEDASEWRKYLANKWGNDGEPEWSFRTLVEGRVEEIDDAGWRNFAENAIDGHWDGFSNGMAIVGRQIDEAWRAAFAAAEMGKGEYKGLRIQPDPANERETFLFVGHQDDVVSDVVSTLHTHSMITDRDVGQIAALDPDTLELPELQRRRLTLILFSVRKPPWRNDDGKRAKRVEISIPNPRRSLTWQQIKQAMGGPTGYEWGGRYAVGRFDSRRKMIVYAPEEATARQRLQALAALSEDNLVSIQTGERVFRINESEENRRRRIRIYPAYLKSVVMRRNATSSTPGVQDLEGNTWRQHSQKINLWPDEPPWNASEIFVQEPLP